MNSNNNYIKKKMEYIILHLNIILNNIISTIKTRVKWVIDAES